MSVTRIDPKQAHQDLESGALLVCAYEQPEKWAQCRLNGAISLADLQGRQASMSKAQPLIFYCA